MAKQKRSAQETDRPKVMRTFFIYTDQDESLEELAADRGKGVAKADLVREALDEFIKKQGGRPKKAATR